MSPDCKVIRVKPWAPSQGDFVEINATDFDAEKHERYEEPVAPMVEPAEVTLPPVVAPVVS